MNSLKALFAAIALNWSPPPNWTISEWADKTRRLSPEGSAEPGAWRTSRAEYQRGIMDCIRLPEVEQVVLMLGSQVGKTETLNNVVGFHIDHDPCSILFMEPTLEMAESWSKERLSPMLRDTPELGSKIITKERKGGNRILHKSFRGGFIAIAGANSPSSLAMRPIRILLCDEVDRYPASAGDEGDPISLASRRTATFWNRKIILVSTPTIKGHSRIEMAFGETDKRYYLIPCPACKTPHRLEWANVRWEEGRHKETACFSCPHCETKYSNGEKNAAVKSGKWVATAPFQGKAGFHISALYSPWLTIGEMVSEFLESKGNPERLKAFVNTILGEAWEEGGKVFDEMALMGRCEEYSKPVPPRVLIMTAGIDVQPDRLEMEVVGWGGGEESWSIDYHVINGDPDIPEGYPGSPWGELTEYLRKPWEASNGRTMSISAAFVDSGGANTQAVYNYAKRHKGSNLYAVKGRGGPGIPIVGPPNRKRSGKKRRTVDLYIIGTDNAKSSVMNRLEIESPGPGYCHFPKGRDIGFFRGLTAEKIITKYVKGWAKREWTIIEGRRNEPLDCRVYAFASLMMLAPQFDKLALKAKKQNAALIIERQSETKAQPEEIEKQETQETVKTISEQEEIEDNEPEENELETLNKSNLETKDYTTQARRQRHKRRGMNSFLRRY